MKFKWEGAAIERRTSAASILAVRRGAEYLLEQANRTVPVEEGTLLRSGVVDADGDQATVSYDTKYAARQHEELSYRHSGEGRAKWLEKTFLEEQGHVADFIQAELKKAF